jgi:hypothetical protein
MDSSIAPIIDTGSAKVLQPLAFVSFITAPNTSISATPVASVSSCACPLPSPSHLQAAESRDALWR